MRPHFGVIVIAIARLFLSLNVDVTFCFVGEQRRMEPSLLPSAMRSNFSR